MTLRKILLAAAVVLSVPVMPALAHDDENNGYNSHDRFHDQLSDSHERAHENGFYSRGEHRAYHRALRISMTMPMDIRAPIIRAHYYGYGYNYRVGSLRPGQQSGWNPTHRSIHRKGTEMSRNTIAIAALAALAIGALATSADAHPKLTSVSPVTDVPSKASPTEIKLNSASA